MGKSDEFSATNKKLNNMSTVSPSNHTNTSNKVSIKRYNLGIPEQLFEDVKIISEREGCTVVDILKRFIKIGIIASNPNVKLIIRRENVDTEIFFA